MENIEKQVKKILISVYGMSELDADICIDNICTKEDIISEMAGCLSEEYYRRMSQVHCDTEEMQEFVEEMVEEKLSDLEVYLWFSNNGNDVLESDLRDRIFTLEIGDLDCKHVYFMFDDENNPMAESMLAEEGNLFHLIYDIRKETIKQFRETIHLKEDTEEVERYNNEIEEKNQAVDVYNRAVRWFNNVEKTEDNEELREKIAMLIGQYCYGSEPKNELKALLEENGI